MASYVAHFVISRVFIRSRVPGTGTPFTLNRVPGYLKSEIKKKKKQ